MRRARLRVELGDMTQIMQLANKECWNSNQGPFASEVRVWGVFAAQSCLTLRNPMDCSLPGSSVHGVLQARIPEWVAILLQGVFLTQGWSPGLLHCKWILYHLSHKGSPCTFNQFLLPLP